MPLFATHIADHTACSSRIDLSRQVIDDREVARSHTDIGLQLANPVPLFALKVQQACACPLQRQMDPLLQRDYAGSRDALCLELS
jgi:hypothetical protein